MQVSVCHGSGSMPARWPRSTSSTTPPRHSGRVSLGMVAMGGREPVPGVRRVVADAEAQPLGAGDPGPGADDVLFWSDADRVPGVVPGVVGIEVVVVVGEGDEVLRAGLDVQV